MYQNIFNLHKVQFLMFVTLLLHKFGCFDFSTNLVTFSLISININLLIKSRGVSLYRFVNLISPQQTILILYQCSYEHSLCIKFNLFFKEVRWNRIANRIKGITVEIGDDTTKLSEALEGVNKNIKNTQIQLKDVKKLLKLDPKTTELLSQKQKLLADSTG